MLAKLQHKKFRATVIENNRGEQQPECYLRLKTGRNRAIVVVYHSEFPPALNYHAGDVGYRLNEGDEVEVYADFIGRDTLSTCQRNEYYIRKLN